MKRRCISSIIGLICCTAYMCIVCFALFVTCIVLFLFGIEIVNQTFRAGNVINICKCVLVLFQTVHSHISE